MQLELSPQPDLAGEGQVRGERHDKPLRLRALHFMNRFLGHSRPIRYAFQACAVDSCFAFQIYRPSRDTDLDTRRPDHLSDRYQETFLDFEELIRVPGRDIRKDLEFEIGFTEAQEPDSRRCRNDSRV